MPPNQKYLAPLGGQQERAETYIQPYVYAAPNFLYLTSKVVGSFCSAAIDVIDEKLVSNSNNARNFKAFLLRLILIFILIPPANILILGYLCLFSHKSVLSEALYFFRHSGLSSMKKREPVML